MADERSLEQWQAALEEWLAQTGNGSPVEIGALDDATYAFSEAGLWCDEVDSVSPDQAIQCWRIIERLRAAGSFPKRLRA